MTTRTLSRGLDVLEALASADELGLGPSAVGEKVGLGQTMPLHATSLGKAILAALSESDRETLYRQMDFAPRTSRTIRSVEQFREEIARTQARGYAIDDRGELGAEMATPAGPAGNGAAAPAPTGATPAAIAARG